MSGQGPLRRWKRFFSVFGHIDAAIEAAHPSISRDEFRSVRGRIVEMLCDAQDDDGERAEQLCVALDGAMAESLVTLLEVPVSSRALASGDLAQAVSILGQHESARIRSLTRDVVRRWRSGVQSQLDSAKAAMEALNNLSRLTPPEKERLAIVGNTNVPVATGREETQIKETPVKFSSKRTAIATGKDKTQIKKGIFSSKRTPVATGRNETQSKDTPGKFASKRTPVVGRSCSESDKMLATKRKHPEGYHYQEAENDKSQSKIRVIEDPKMLEQPKEKKMHPINPRESSRARCGSLTTVKRSLMPSCVV